MGHTGAVLVLHNVEIIVPHLSIVHPHGSADKPLYVTMGSGSFTLISAFAYERPTSRYVVSLRELNIT